MGYTHYFELRGDNPPTPKQISEILEKVSLILEKTDVPLWEEYDEEDSEPILNDKFIQFNGVEDDGHETFLFTFYIRDSFNFCKTARKPYDIVVCATLIAIKSVLGDGLELSSDGSIDDKDEWIPAINFYESLFGKLDSEFIENILDD